MPTDSAATNDCVVLFSGGRDSTVAALRLVSEYPNLTLLTVTTEHLVGIDLVRQRLRELKTLLPDTVRWVHAVAQPTSLVTIGRETIESCLPCHHVYLRTAVAVARGLDARNIAVGYAGYQDTWLEQTPYAVQGLRRVLAEFDIQLLLPSADITSKAQAEDILRSKGLNGEALEQKCLKQQFNSKDLSPDDIASEIDAWIVALRKSFQLGILADVDIRSTCSGDKW